MQYSKLQNEKLHHFCDLYHICHISSVIPSFNGANRCKLTGLFLKLERKCVKVNKLPFLITILFPLFMSAQNEVCFDIESNPDPFNPASLVFLNTSMYWTASTYMENPKIPMPRCSMLLQLPLNF